MKLERQLSWPCGDCTVRGSSLCTALTGGLPAAQTQTAQVFMTADKHEVVGHSGTALPSGPFVLCKGWAYRFYRFPDGRRQILSVLLPGDLFSSFAVGNAQPGFSVQSATDIQYCEFGRDDIRRQLSESSVAFDMFGKFWAQEADEANAALIYLNQHDPTSRVMDFLQRLVKRLVARDIRISNDVYPFPLTHADIADATGLTVDSVNRSIHFLREDSVIDLSNDRLTIIDTEEFDINRPAFIRHASINTPADAEIRLFELHHARSGPLRPAD